MHRRPLAFMLFLVVSILTGSRAFADEGAQPSRGFGLSLRGTAAYPLAAGATLGAEVNPSRAVAIELALGGTAPLRKNDDEGGLDAMLGARFTLAPDTTLRPYLMAGAHYRSVSGTYGGDVSVPHAFLGGYGGVGVEQPLSAVFVVRTEVVGSLTPRLAIGENTQGDDLRAQLRVNLGLTAYF